LANASSFPIDPVLKKKNTIKQKPRVQQLDHFSQSNHSFFVGFGRRFILITPLPPFTPQSSKNTVSEEERQVGSGRANGHGDDTLHPAATALTCSLKPSLSLSKPIPSHSLSKITPRSDLKPNSLSLLQTSTTLSLFAVETSSPEAKAALPLSKDQIVSSLTQVEKTIDEVSKVGSNFFDLTRQVFGVVADFVKPEVDAALPILQQAAEQALKIASPAISEASKKAQDAIQGSGLDTEPVVKDAKVIEEAKPIASSTVEIISSADAGTIVATAGALFVAYFLLPPIWSAISFSLRGYQGDLTPAQTLDLVSTKNYFIIDIRSEKDKNKAGIPRIPAGAKNKLIAILLEELPSKLRGLVRNPKKIEAEIAALKISYLKKISKGSIIIILDSYLDSAKIVARYLTSLGFKNCWIVADGLGWLQSQLGTDSYNVSIAEVLSPSRVIPAAVRRFGTTRSSVQPNAKLVAYALEALGLDKGSAIAINKPMNVKSVVIYLAIVLAGFVVVSIADSFAPSEISTRMKLSEAKAIFT
ncbi:AMP-dependent synthetase/ligase, partial [Dillenia turbinata]